MKMRLHEFSLPLRHTFTISRGAVKDQPTLIVELEHYGLRGYGEATANPYYHASVEQMQAVLETVRDKVEGWDASEPQEFWESLAPRLGDHSFARCALDLAAWDLWGKLQGQPLYQLWGLSTKDLPRSSYTIGMDDPEIMAAKLREFPHWPIYKIKLGGERDLESVRRLRQETDAVFRVDANCGWTFSQAVEHSQALKELNVEFIEQPLPAEQNDEMPRLKAASALPLIADESCSTLEDIEACAAGFDGINIKLVKCGGLTPARKMIERARQHGLQVMVGCMTESSVGISAAAQLLPLLDYADLDGAALLAEDIAVGVSVENGVCRYSRENGCGVDFLKK